MTARVLIIAGSDSGGGAGIQGDIKTITCLGGYASSAITALTAQNTQGVFGIHDVPPAFIEQQMRLVLDDIGADIIKTGMLHTVAVIRTVAAALNDYPNIPLVLDPVMAAKGGAALLAPDAVDAIKKLAARAVLLTPNIPEAALLCGFAIHSPEDMEKAGRALLPLGCRAVLIKGGHLEGPQLTDVLVTQHTVQRFASARLPSGHTHGTGCTLASAIATYLAQGEKLEKAVERARAYVYEAIRTAPGLGKGHGPLNHNNNLASRPSS